MSKKRIVTLFIYVTLLVNAVFGAFQPAPVVQAAAAVRTDAVVLVNSASTTYYLDFRNYIQPYLDHFGVPYTVVDIKTTAVPTNIGDYALIIIGHRQLDTGGTYLSSAEQTLISSAVNAGAGLVNFDNDLSANASTARYEYINSVFGFGYKAPPTLGGISFANVSHYITQDHTLDEQFATGNQTLAGITLPAGTTALAYAGTGTEPFLAVKSYGQGRAVQWGSYNWMSITVWGPVYGLDDLVWRSLVWAARKPFVMQGLPRFTTFRMDDTSNPLTWIPVANQYGWKPWAGVFINDINDIDTTEAAGLSELANAGKATVAIHAFNTSTFFYFNHGDGNNGSNLTDAQVTANFNTGNNWFNTYNIPKSKYVVGHYYELGSNVFEELGSWGVEFIGAPYTPGQSEGNALWVKDRPFRLYETAANAGTSQLPLYHADYLTIPNHPELNNKFFNCITEIRDVNSAKYEWVPSNNVTQSVQEGSAWLKRAYQGMDLATLFSHEYFIPDLEPGVWNQIMQGISQELAPYNPIYTTIDDACQYVRAVFNSNITSGSFDPATSQLTVGLTGTTDVTTKFYAFYDVGGAIQQIMFDVPQFTAATQKTYALPGALHHITVTPNPASVVAGGTKQFTAQAFDANGTEIPNLPFTWSATGGGTITSTGLFTAGTTLGTFTNAVTAASDGIQGSATVTVTQAVLDHFSFDPISGTKYQGMPFQVTLRARDASENPVVTFNGAVTLGASTGAIQPTTATLANGVWTGSVTIGATNSSVTLSATNGSKSGTSAAFKVDPPRTCPCTIWDNTTIPATGEQSLTDDVPIEVGVKFKADVDGYITGLRFFKGSLNTGTHTGHLWDAAGNLLATATFVNETSSGWQQVSLSNPVPVTANTTYVASYYSPNGYFAATTGGLTSAVFNAPLRALANGEEGPNGVYNYNSTGFPSTASTSIAPNYWVDVVFELTPGVDTTAPTVVTKSPDNGLTGVSPFTNVTVKFSEAIDPATITASTFTLKKTQGSVAIPATVTYTDTAWTATLDPGAQLEYSTNYTATLKGGASGVKDRAGNPLAADISWSFTVMSAPPVPADEGPGGPILVLSNSANPFSRYYTEILRAEGLNSYKAIDISKVTATTLAGYSVIILGEMSLTAAQVTMLTDWVNAGGNLIAMRPDPQLAGLLGLTGPNGSRLNAYLKIDTSKAPGQGLVSETIQYHGAADLYALNGATSVATLYSTASAATTNPAVTLRTVGTSGGQAAAFAYDLARSVVYTRQGNPDWAGQDRDTIYEDGQLVIRSNDLFFGSSISDPQPDWVDMSKVAIPQADEQQRLLANLIEKMELDKMPLPHFWYLPNSYKAVVVMTGDDHNGTYTPDHFNQFIAASTPGCSVNDWACIRATAYIYPGNTMTNAQALSFANQGFEVALHVSTDCVDWTPTELGNFYTNQLTQWKAQYTSIPGPLTERTHCITWSDWATQAKVELSKGMRLDTNYYYWPDGWVQNRPGLFTGSGFPMRFADMDGSMIDVYQATTHMTDESGQTYPYTIDNLLAKALGTEGYYGVFTANFHHDAQTNDAADEVVAAAKASGVPVISASQLLTWLDGRNNSSFKNLAWNAATSTLTFSLTIDAGARNLQVLLPTQASSGPLSILTLNNVSVNYTNVTIKGVDYASFKAGAGTYSATYTTGVNYAPVAMDDSYNANQGEALTVSASGVLANDTDANPGDTLTAKLVTGPAHGTLTLNADGSFTYTSVATYVGSDSFTYKANDGKADSGAATVNLTVAQVNHAPVAVADSYSVAEGGSRTEPKPGVLINDTDIDPGTTLTASLVTGPTKGTLTLNADGSFTYTTTDPNYNGPDSFTYKANDGKADSAPVTVTITITPVNDAPVAVADSYTTNEDAPLTVPSGALVGVLANDSDVDTGDKLTAILVTGPTKGTLTLNSDGSFVYAPAKDQNGSDTFTYKANDGKADSNTVTVTITIKPVNDAPVAVNDTFYTKINTSVTFKTADMLSNDSDVDNSKESLTLVIVKQPKHGTLTKNSDGSYTYTPEKDYTENDTFTYTVSDGALTSGEATVTISQDSIPLFLPFISNLKP